MWYEVWYIVSALPTGFSNLAHKILPKRKPAEPTCDPPPKPLAEDRKYALTPSQSRESLIPNPQLSSKFFTALSAELRIAILTEAFGGRTMHIHYHDNRPLNPHSQPQPKRSRWKKKRPLKYSEKLPRPELNGTVCTRTRYSKDGLRSHDPGLYEDTCFAFYPREPDWPEEALFPIRVGAMGWLCSCRRAYAEGLEILYGSNGFHIQSPRLAANLTAFFVPQRLERIKKLELALEWGRYRRYSTREEGPFDVEFARILKNIQTLFPRLTTLELALQDNLYVFCARPYDDTTTKQDLFVPWMEKIVLGPLDAMVREMENLQSCKVYLTGSVRWSLRQVPGLEAVREEHSPGMAWRTRDAWRTVDGESGYWVCEGRDDSPKMVCGLAFS